MSTDTPIIWVVDDDPDVAEHLQLLLGRDGVAAAVVAMPDAATLRVALDGDEQPTAVLLDEVLPDGRGTVLAADVHARRPGAHVRIVTAAPDEIDDVGRAVGVVAKPLAPADIAPLLPDPS